MTGDEAVAEVRRILVGIDKDETTDSEGWWPTSVGVEFGAARLAGVEALVRRLVEEA